MVDFRLGTIVASLLAAGLTLNGCGSDSGDSTPFRGEPIEFNLPSGATPVEAVELNGSAQVVALTAESEVAFEVTVEAPTMSLTGCDEAAPAILYATSVEVPYTVVESGGCVRFAAQISPRDLAAQSGLQSADDAELIVSEFSIQIPGLCPPVEQALAVQGSGDCRVTAVNDRVVFLNDAYLGALSITYRAPDDSFFVQYRTL